MPDSIQIEFGKYVQTLQALTDALPLDQTGHPALYYGVALQDTSADPYITWTCPSNVEELEVGGPPFIANAEMAMVCHSKDPDGAHALAAVLKSLFRFQPLPFNMGTFVVLGTWNIETSDDDAGAAEYGLFRITVKIGLQYEIH